MDRSPSPEDIFCFRKLRAILTGFFADEDVHRDQLIKILREDGIIPPGGHLNPKTIGKLTTDGDLRVSETFSEFLYVQEVKNEFSTGGAEPYFECIHYWWAKGRRVDLVAGEKENTIGVESDHINDNEDDVP
jgi:hypothetical protein